MQIKQETFLEILGVPQTQFVVPVYQRIYSWTNRQCQALWSDIMTAGETGRSHFTGLLLYAEDPESWDNIGRLRIIDGQQRTTTVSLILIALDEALKKGSVTVEGLDPGFITQHYLKVSGEADAPCKLQLSHLDRGTLATLIEEGEMPKEHSERLVENLNIFREKIAQEDFDAQQLWKGLRSLQIISVLLEDSDQPQLIFESLNSKGAPLTAGDLLRNALLFGANEAERQALYEKHWQPLEKAVEDIEGATMDSLIRAWLATRFRDERVRSDTDIYAVLKEYLRTSDETLESLLDELYRFGNKYVSKPDWRVQADKQAVEWLRDKPRAGVSQFKMFGD